MSCCRLQKQKQKIERKKKELYFGTSKPFQSKRNEQTNSRKNEKTGVTRIGASTLEKKKQNRHRRSIIIKVKKTQNGQ
jgi:hypothetical protein